VVTQAGGELLLSAFTSDSLPSKSRATEDALLFVHRPATGDVTFTAKVLDWSDDFVAWSGLGVMIRGGVESLALNGCTKARPLPTSVASEARTDLAFNYRDEPAPGGFHPKQTTLPGRAPFWLRIERRGDRLTGSSSSDGRTWTPIGAQTVRLPPQILVGVVLWNEWNRSTARFGEPELTMP
jgi:hypothetical protein